MHRLAWKQWPAVRNLCLGEMDPIKSRDVHPIEIAILLVWLLLEAIATLAVALGALVVTLAGWRQPAAAAPAPVVHPLALVAAELEALPVRSLRPMVPVQCRRLPKARLIGELLACS